MTYPMNAVVQTAPMQAALLGFSDVGREIAVTTEDASVRGMLWSLEFREGSVKVCIKSRSGMNFITLQPADTVYTSEGSI